MTGSFGVQSSVSLAKYVIGRERWRTFDRNRLLLLRGPLGALRLRVPLATNSCVLFRGDFGVFPDADAGAVTHRHAPFHSL